MPENQPKDAIKIITGAFNKSKYFICATGMRDIDYNEMYELFKTILESDPEELKSSLFKLHKYHPNTIECDKSLNIYQCDELKSDLCNCWLPDIEYTDYYCYQKRRAYLETTDYRNTPEYKEWRLSVFRRDKYTCLDCSQRGGELNAHHIKTFKKFPKLRYEISNGETLCVKCHREKHRNVKK